MNKSVETILNNKWVSEEDACDLLSISIKTLRNRCRNGELNHRVVKESKKLKYYIHSDCLPKIYTTDLSQEDINDEKYADIPNWAKVQADRYINIIKNTLDLKGINLKNYINNWNKNNPNLSTSYDSIIRMRKRYKKEGLKGLFARYGHSANKIFIKPEIFNYFKNLYLVEGAKKTKSCWDITLGYGLRKNIITRDDMAKLPTFLRQLRKEVPPEVIYLARYGETAYNKKFGNYIERDYSTEICGEVWVSDHAQIDIAVIDENGNSTFPWVTVWRDYKSGKWLGWVLECGSPNSDRIFQAFYNAAIRYGLPKDVIIDNGKDYRSKDFAGGRNRDPENKKGKITSMLDELNVEVHFALPYNAQTKPVERDFLKIKELLSKHCRGYRGGNIVERPERLLNESKNERLMNISEFKLLFDDFILNVLNKRPSMGKNLNGKCPDDLFEDECKEVITPSRDALKLFCMRISNNYTISRNGIKDRKLNITYWADWMIQYMKTKVYLRRDPNDYTEAWVFRLSNDEFIGKCSIVRPVAALHADIKSKEEFQEAMSIKKRSIKIAKSYLDQLEMISAEELCENYKAAYEQKKREHKKPKVTKIANTKMDLAIRKNKEMESYGKNDLTMFLPEKNETEEELYLFETDRFLEEELKGVANG